MADFLRINASSPYDVVVGSGTLERLGSEINGLLHPDTVAIMTDDIVDRLYADAVMRSFADAGIRCCKYVFPHGEQSKQASTVLDFITFMAEHGMTRTDVVIALGGGVTGDMTGFAAAICMRGIRYVQVPTTLLAMVDSSVGGKTAVDLPSGKNLIGAFYQPSEVWCDTDTLKTLPADILRDGFAEVIKYGVLMDKDFFDSLTPSSDILEVVKASVHFKQKIVEEDEREKGCRALLNLGHTTGHAIEKLSGYTLSHGQAVAKGLVLAARMASAYGFEDCTEAVSSKLEQFGFDLNVEYTAEQIWNSALSDKKRNGSDITLVLPEKIGQCGLYRMDIGKFRKLLETSI